MNPSLLLYLQVVQETVLALGMVLPSSYLVYKCESWIDMFVLWVDSPDLHVKAKAAIALSNIARCGRCVSCVGGLGSVG